MLPSETRPLESTWSERPPWTKPTSTANFGSASRLRFSSEPSDGRISSFSPLRPRIFAYFSALRRPTLPSGPLVMMIVPGGAGRTKWTAIQMATTLTSRTGPRDATRSRHETREIRHGMRSGPRGRFAPSSAITALPLLVGRHRTPHRHGLVKDDRGPEDDADHAHRDGGEDEDGGDHHIVDQDGREHAELSRRAHVAPGRPACDADPEHTRAGDAGDHERFRLGLARAQEERDDEVRPEQEPRRRLHERRHGQERGRAHGNSPADDIMPRRRETAGDRPHSEPAPSHGPRTLGSRVAQ